MPIHATCPCGKAFLTNEQYAGKLVKCPGCGQPLRIPDPQQAMEVTSFEEEDDDGGGYGMAPEDPTLPPVRAGAERDSRLSGAIGDIHLSPQDEVVSCLALSPDAMTAVAAIESTVYVLDLRAGRRFFPLQGHDRAVTCVAVSPDASYALSAYEDNNILVWDVRGRRGLHWLQGHHMRVHDLAFLPGGTHAVSVGGDGAVCLWDVATGQRIGGFRESETLTRAAVSPDGKWLAVGSADERVLLWDLRSGEVAQKLKDPPPGAIEALAFTRDGTRILAAGFLGKRARWCFWDWARDKGRFRKAGEAGPVKCRALAFCPDGERLFCGGEAIREWRRDDLLAEIWLTPVFVMRTADGSETRRFPGHLKKQPGLGARFLHEERAYLATIHCVAVSANGARAISGADDGRVMSWGLA